MPDAPVVLNKWAIPAGQPGNLIEFSKFLLTKRDTSCTQCRNRGVKSILMKLVDGKNYSVPIMCICVPIVMGEAANGSLIVSYKGYREEWPNGERPESLVHADLIKANAGDPIGEKRARVMDDARAHDNNNSTSGKFSIGPITPMEAAELGAMVVNDLKPKFDSTGNEIPAPPKKVVKTRVAMPGGGYIFTDQETADKILKINAGEIPVDSRDRTATINPGDTVLVKGLSPEGGETLEKVAPAQEVYTPVYDKPMLRKSMTPLQMFEYQKQLERSIQTTSPAQVSTPAPVTPSAPRVTGIASPQLIEAIKATVLAQLQAEGWTAPAAKKQRGRPRKEKA